MRGQRQVKRRVPSMVPEADETGDVFEQPVFVDKGELGRGGMGVVHRLWDPRILRDTAVKYLDTAAGKPERIPRFIEEAQITGQLEHPHIVPVHDFGIDESGRMYINMKLIEGETLWQRVENLGSERLSTEHLGDLVQALVSVCDAVAYAHSRGVVHRDLKASNVMLGEYGQVYVLDWGIARVMDDRDELALVNTSSDQVLDRPDALVGTPSWMSPEQACAEHDLIEERTDVFAIGALLYFVLTGQAPYGGRGDVIKTIRHAQLGRFTPPSEIDGIGHFPLQLERVVLRAMALEHEDRYDSVLDLKAELRQFLRGTWSFPTVHFSTDSVVVREGEPGDRAYVVQSGTLLVTRGEGDDEVVLRTLGPGDCLGELAVFRQSVRSATVTAVEDCELVEVTQEALAEGLGLNTWMGTFVKALATRFLELEDNPRQ